MNRESIYQFSSTVFIALITIGGACCSFETVSISEKSTQDRASAHILLYSDIGYANEGQYKVTEAMAGRHAVYPFTFVISAGDNIQLRPEILGPRSMLWGNDVMEEIFERPFAALIREGVRFYAAPGNHDHQGLRFSMEISYSEKVNAQGRGVGGFVLPAPDYVVRRNGVKIVFLDVATAFSNLNWSEPRAAFARRMLSAQEDTWRILVMHYPLWSSGEHGNDKALSDLREVMLPILNECPVDFVISGHDHHAELFHYQGKIKTRMAIVGNTAKPHDLPNKPEIRSIFHTRTQGFAEIDVQDTRAVLSFISADGTVMFSDVVQK